MDTGIRNTGGVPRDPSSDLAARQRRRGRRLRYALESYLFLLPFGLPFAVFLLYPVLFGFYISFHDWDFLVPVKPFVALRNYAGLFADMLFIKSLGNTLYYVVLTSPALIILGLLFAVLLNTDLRGKGAFRGAIFAAYLLPVSVVAVIWSWLMQTRTGILNYYLKRIGIGSIPWLASVEWSMPSIAITSVWWTVGFGMVIFLAGLQDIPQQLHEAAQIDGAGAWGRFWWITLPLLRPSILFVTVITIIRSFQVFGQVYIMTLGGPADSTRTIVQNIYESGFRYYRMGSASAQAFALLAILAILTYFQFRIGGSREVSP
jgi:multiple sugar transport system permease protein